MIQEIKDLNGKKIYFASDFHLGVPSHEESLKREKKIIRWLNKIQHDAHSIYLLGDIFDFWFEYRHAIPKGFIRILGKLAELKDNGINIIFFTGNHDMWMFDYFPTELGIPIYREPITLKTENHLLQIGHGDGLGPGDHVYKVLKKFFASKVCQWLFARIHPNLGIGIANAWSKKSRVSSGGHGNETFENKEKEYIWQHCKATEAQQHHDWYIFGHRHLPLELDVTTESKYINLGEWVTQFTYGVYDGNSFKLIKFEEQ